MSDQDGKPVGDGGEDKFDELDAIIAEYTGYIPGQDVANRLRNNLSQLIQAREREARLDEQQRTGRLTYKAGDGPLVFFQHDGSTCITQNERLEQLKPQASEGGEG